MTCESLDTLQVPRDYLLPSTTPSPELDQKDVDFTKLSSHHLVDYKFKPYKITHTVDYV